MEESVSQKTIRNAASLAQAVKGDWQPHLVFAMGVAMFNSNQLADAWEWEWEYDVDFDMGYFNNLFLELWQNAWVNSHNPVAHDDMEL